MNNQSHRNLIINISVGLILLITCFNISARNLFTKDEAIKYIFPEACETITQTNVLTPEQKRKVKKICRSKMIQTS